MPRGLRGRSGLLICPFPKSTQMEGINRRAQILFLSAGIIRKIIKTVSSNHKNKKLQMLFSTRNAIYLFDRNGNNMRGFPISLKSSATSPVSVFDYEQNHDYRIFIACASKIFCYKTNGEELSSFKCGKIWFAQDEKTQPSSIKNLEEVETFLLRSIISTKSEGSVSLKSLTEERFDYPKPIDLIEQLLSSINDNNGIYLDSFAG